MKVFVLLALVAAAYAAPTSVADSDAASVVEFDHIAHVPATFYSHAIPSTFYSNSLSHGAFPSTFVSGSAAIPTTYLAGSSFPTVYSAGSPLAYTGSVVSPAVIPKYFAENKGAQHIVNY